MSTYHDDNGALDPSYDALTPTQIDKIVAARITGSHGRATEDEILECLREFHQNSLRTWLFNEVMAGRIVLTGTDVEHDWEHTDIFQKEDVVEQVAHAVRAYLECEREPRSRNQIETAIPGKAATIRAACISLLESGQATEMQGPRGARLMLLMPTSSQ